MIYPSGYGGHRSRGSEWVDFDNDGDLDLYVTNYYLERDELWRNNGDGTFTNIISGKGSTFNSQGGQAMAPASTGVIMIMMAIWTCSFHSWHIPTLLYLRSPQHHHYRNEGSPNFNFTDLHTTDGIDYEETHSGGSWEM